MKPRKNWEINHDLDGTLESRWFVQPRYPALPAVLPDRAATSLNTRAHITATGGGHTEQTRTQRDCLVKTFINSLFQLPRHFSFLSIITYPSYINTTLNIVARTVTNLPAIAAEVRFRFNMSYTGLWERRREVNIVTNPNSVAPLNQGQIFSFIIQRKAGNAVPFLPLQMLAREKARSELNWRMRILAEVWDQGPKKLQK